MKKIKLLNDIILIAAVLLIAAIGLCVYSLLREPGQKVIVTVDGEQYAEYDLNGNIDEEIVSKYGKNRLIIKDGKATISEATCPDLICVHHRAISMEGESITCLPNRVVVSIE